MPTLPTPTNRTAQIAALVRALPDAALCTLLDLAQVAYDDAWLADMADGEDDFAAIEATLEAAYPSV